MTFPFVTDPTYWTARNTEAREGRSSPLLLSKAPLRLSPILALAFEIWTALGGSRDPRSDSADGQGRPAMGSAPDHGELLKLGIQISQATVAKYMVRRRGKPFTHLVVLLEHSRSGITAIDMLAVTSYRFGCSL